MDPEKLIEGPEKTNNNNENKKLNFEMHSVMIPPNRLTPLKNSWEKIC